MRGKGRVAIRLRPCPGNATPQFQIDTAGAGFRQGPNELRVCAADFAPEATANHTCETRTVRIDNACPISGTPGSVLRARFKGAGGRMTAPSNEPATVIGSPHRRRRRSPSAAPRSASPPESTPPRARPSASSPPPPPAPTAASRSACPQAQAARSESPTGTAPTRSPSASSISAQEPSPAWPSSQPEASRTETAIRFDVRIPGPAQVHRRVAIQARGTGKWIRIDGGRTDRGGRWSGHYRFQSTTSTRTLRLPSNDPPPTRLPLQPGPTRRPAG